MGGLLEGRGRWSAFPPAAGVAAQEKCKTVGVAASAVPATAADVAAAAAAAEMEDPFHDDWAFWHGPAQRQGGSSLLCGSERPGPEPCTRLPSPSQ